MRDITIDRSVGAQEMSRSRLLLEFTSEPHVELVGSLFVHGGERLETQDGEIPWTKGVQAWMWLFVKWAAFRPQHEDDGEYPLPLEPAPPGGPAASVAGSIKVYTN